MDTRPGEGERRAASGYRAQYLVGAAVILESLRSGDLEWVRVADPEAGRVDDFQIGRTARLDAYQVKWEQYTGTLTLNKLTSIGKAPALVAQLADGWSKLKTQHPHRRIVVHLVTNAFASKATRILPETAYPPKPYHFAAFLEQAWKPARRNGDIDYEGVWGAVWYELRNASGLDEVTFPSFVHDCALDLRVPTPPEDEDHLAIADLLFTIAATPERIVELDRTELLNRLGWRRRYDYRISHDFNIPRFYRPIASTIEEVIERLGHLSGGYIGVIGSPGSGKSTLLTRTLRSLTVRLIRYYAYVPEMQDPTVLRGESAIFLHDVTHRMEAAGFGRARRRPDPADRPALLERFHEQLQALGADYAVTGMKTVILVDGLDHIAREQRPERSLLADLPFPDKIPDGVYFILGTQTILLEDLPPLVRREVSRSDRCVEMGRLSPADVAAIAAEVVPELDGEERQQLFELSAGHPLVLIYIIKRLQLTKNNEARTAILAEAGPYSDDIDTYYWSHWEQVQDDSSFIHALGLLSRVRGAIAMDWAAQWIERPVAVKLERLFQPYFDIDAAGRWSFFHNSFRLFLQAHTAQPILGQSPEARERAFHSELAERYAGAEAPWFWEALYHLYRADDHVGVVALATSEWFRNQAMALRPLDAVQADVRLAIRSAGISQDPLALVRLTLVAAALEQQKFILEDFDIADFLLDLGDVPQALELIRDGDALRVEKEHAIYLGARLAGMGMAREGIRLFELAEPYNLFSGQPLSGKQWELRDTWPVLKGWAEAAPQFRAPADVLGTVDRLEVEPDPSMDETPEETTANLQRELVIRAAVACAQRGVWDDWEEYRRWLDERKWGGLFEVLLRSAEAAKVTEPQRARKLLQRLLEDYEPIPLKEAEPHRIEARVAVAELALFLEEDEKVGAAWVADLEALPIQSESVLAGDRFLSHDTNFHLCRLQYWLGEVRDPSTLVAERVASTAWGSYTKNEEKTGLRQLALMETTLAALWGKGRRGENLLPSAFLGEVRWVLDLLRAPPEGPTGLLLEVSASRPRMVDFLVQSATQHSKEVVRALAGELVRRWEQGEWFLSLRRIAVVALVKAGAEEQARELLTLLEGEMLGDGDPRERAEEHWKQAKAWLKLRDKDAARAELRRMIAGSRGLLDDHDHQSEVWVRWVGRVNTLAPDSAENRIRTMLRRLVAVSDEASGISDAAEELIAVTFRWSPLRAAHLMKGLQEKGMLGHAAALSSLLKASMEASIPPVNSVLLALGHLLIPIASPRGTGLVGALLEGIVARFGEDAAISTARYLVRKVRAEALSTDRQTWLKQIAEGLEEVGVPYTRASIELSDLEDRQQNSTSSVDSNTLYFLGGGEISLCRGLSDNTVSL